MTICPFAGTSMPFPTSTSGGNLPRATADRLSDPASRPLHLSDPRSVYLDDQDRISRFGSFSPQAAGKLLSY
jgi:hypothetical protein